MKWSTRPLARRSQSRSRASSARAASPRRPRPMPLTRDTARRGPRRNASGCSSSRRAAGRAACARPWRPHASSRRRGRRRRRRATRSPAASAAGSCGTGFWAKGRRWMNVVVARLPAIRPRRSSGRKSTTREEVGLREQPNERREHVLAAAPGVEPVVDDGDAHEGRTESDDGQRSTGCIGPYGRRCSGC